MAEARAITIFDGTHDVRILTPWEEGRLYQQLNTDYKILSRAWLYSYMRLPEFRFLLKHQDCFHEVEQCIVLPEEAETKVKHTHISRRIPLTKDGCTAIKELFDHYNSKGLYIPKRQAILPALKLAARKAGLPDGDKGIMPKMYRKSFLSWLVEVYGNEKLLKIAKSAGHTSEVLEQNYVGIFTVKRDIEDMKDILKNWGEA